MNLIRSLFLTSILGLSSFVLKTEAHSWVECTDYRGQRNYWDANACQGRARCSEIQSKSAFGQDTGFNFKGNTCQCPYSKSAETYKQVKMAQYTPGQRVCLAYPPKNHVADKCTNAYIPDAFVKIYRTAKGATDDRFIKTYNHMNGQHVNGQVDYKGFQHCPKFCENMDKALCTLCFNLEKNIAPGTYSFRWEWAFNDAGDLYSTCWEATVKGPTLPRASGIPLAIPQRALL